MSLAGYPKATAHTSVLGQAIHDTANTVARHSAFSCHCEVGAGSYCTRVRKELFSNVEVIPNDHFAHYLMYIPHET